ncbi:hypothetical protein Tco_1216327 [Tanacetum coccineum]
MSRLITSTLSYPTCQRITGADVQEYCDDEIVVEDKPGAEDCPYLLFSYLIIFKSDPVVDPSDVDEIWTAMLMRRHEDDEKDVRAYYPSRRMTVQFETDDVCGQLHPSPCISYEQLGFTIPEPITCTSMAVEMIERVKPTTLRSGLGETQDEIYTMLDDEQNRRQLLAVRSICCLEDRFHAQMSEITELQSTDRSRRRAISDLLEIDRGRREEMRELRTADRTRQHQIIQTLTGQVTVLQGTAGRPAGGLHSQSCQREVGTTSSRNVQDDDQQRQPWIHVGNDRAFREGVCGWNCGAILRQRRCGVHDFPEVFLEDLSGLPHDSTVEFQIDLVRGAAPLDGHLIAWRPSK